MDTYVRVGNQIVPYTSQAITNALQNNQSIGMPPYPSTDINFSIPNTSQQATQQNQPTGWWNTEFGNNLGTYKFGLDAATALFGAFNAIKANNLAKEQLDFTKKMAIANYNNNVAQWNQQVADRGASRAYFGNGDWKDWVNTNSLKEWGK